MNKKNLSFADEVNALTVDEKELQQSIERLNKARTKHEGGQANQLAVVGSTTDLEPNAAGSRARPESKPKAEKTERPKKKVVTEWGEPTATLNTRIPPEMNELLSELVYRSKKIDRRTSKQRLIVQAIEASLAKHGLIPKPG